MKEYINEIENENIKLKQEIKEIEKNYDWLFEENQKLKMDLRCNEVKVCECNRSENEITIQKVYHKLRKIEFDTKMKENEERFKKLKKEKERIENDIMYCSFEKERIEQHYYNSND